jgi:hypothetical protein
LGIVAAGSVGDIGMSSTDFGLARYLGCDAEPCPTPTPAPLCADTPRAGCKAAGKSTFQVKDKSTDERQQVLWKWLAGAATTVAELGDPIGTTEYGFCVYDTLASPPDRVMSAVLAPNGTWETVSTSGFQYKDKSAATSGFFKVQLKSGSDGDARIIVKMRGAAIPLPAPATASLFFQQDPDLVVQLVNSDGNCWEASYSMPADANTAERFKDRNPP